MKKKMINQHKNNQKNQQIYWMLISTFFSRYQLCLQCGTGYHGQQYGYQFSQWVVFLLIRAYRAYRSCWVYYPMWASLQASGFLRQLASDSWSAARIYSSLHAASISVS